MLLEAFQIIILLLITYNFNKILLRSIFNSTDIINSAQKCLIFKFTGTFIYCFVYWFAYEGGDTINFYNMSKAFNECLRYNPEIYYHLFNIDNENFAFYSESYEYVLKIQAWARNELSSYTVIKLAALLNILSFNSFVGTSLLFAYLSFWGLILITKTLHNISNLRESNFSIYVILLTPSLLFWCSGINKDSLIIFFTGLSAFSFMKITQQRNFLNPWLLIIIASLYFIAIIKLYVLICIIITLLILLIITLFSSFKKSFSLLILSPFIILLISGFILVTVNTISNFGDRYDISKIEKQIIGVQSYHKQLSNNESGYDLDLKNNPTLNDQIIASPKALITTLFKPFIWEVKSPLTISYALENMILTSIFILLLLSGHINKLWSAFRSNKTVQFCFIFTLIFSITVGLLSFNYGALARYRTPMLPFLVFGLIYTYNFIAFKNSYKASE